MGLPTDIVLEFISFKTTARAQTITLSPIFTPYLITAFAPIIHQLPIETFPANTAPGAI